jgi:deoxycytidylate deaminase
MNSKLANKAIEIARALKPNRATGKNFHVSLISKRNKVVAIGWNDYTKSHKHKRFGEYKDHKKHLTKYEPCLHSEISACIRFGEESLKGFDIINVRIGNDEKVRLSHPCPNCLRVLSGMNPKNIYFTNNQGDFERCQQIFY